VAVMRRFLYLELIQLLRGKAVPAGFVTIFVAALLGTHHGGTVIQRQKNAMHGDLVNPLLAAFGNFDLAFVLVLLTPLFLIALCYDVWSSEREHGTWMLIRSQPTNSFRVLLLKLAVRGTAVLVISVAASLAAAVLLKLTVDVRLFHVVLLIVLYTAAWTGIAGTVVGMGRSSDFNLITLVGLWMFFALLAPAIANVVVAIRYPLPEALELTVRQRQGYHGAWDRPVRETMAALYAQYPEWEGFAVPEDRYSNAWYYAMQQRGDQEAAPAAGRYFTRLEQRSGAMAGAAALIPPVALQLALNSVAQTDLDSHLRYLDSVKSYHEELKRFFFPVIFNERSIAEVDWAAAPKHQHHDSQASKIFNMYTGKLICAAAVSLTATWLTLRRRMRSEHVS
jgi:ABC-2 type transport system permease protein